MEMKRVAQKKLEGRAQWKGFGVWTRMKGRAFRPAEKGHAKETGL